MSTDNVNEIYPGLWLGDIYSPNPEFIKNNKITCIINCTLTVPFPKLKQIKYRYRIPVKDNLQVDQIYLMYSMFDPVIEFILQHLPNEQILIHCHAGRQRSVAIIAAFLMKSAEMTKDEAIMCIQSKRLVAALPQLNFNMALTEYEKDLNKLKNKCFK